MRALERFLVDLGLDSGPAPPERARTAALEPRVPTSFTKDLEARLEQAYERGKAQAAAEAEQILAARLRQAEAAVEGRIAAVRAQWVAEESGRLTERLETGLGEIHSSIADIAARILKPFLLDRVRDEAVESLASTIAEAVRHREGVRIEIAGPADLTAAIKERIVALRIAADVREAEAPDVRVTVGLTALETSLGAWMTRIEEAIG